MNSSRGKFRYIIGGILIAIGVLLLLSNTNVINLDWGWDLVRTWWPLLLIIWGLWELVSGGFRFRLWPIILLMLGIGFQLSALELWEWNVWQFWPALIVLVGLAILLGRPRQRPRRRRNNRLADADAEPEGNRNPSGNFPGGPGSGSGDSWHSTNVFSGGEERIASREFRGGEVTAIFGGTKLDLRDANLAGGAATLEATVCCGGIELRVPRNWRVNLQTTTLLGGTENNRPQPAPAEATGELTVSGTVVLGGIQVVE